MIKKDLPSQNFTIESENHRTEPQINLLVCETPANLGESQKTNNKWKWRLGRRKEDSS